MTSTPPYKRILLKLSGEALQGDLSYGIDAAMLDSIAGELQAVQEMGVEVAIVVGGGNIFRGAAGEKTGIDRATGDQIGMLATVANGLALRAVLQGHGIAARTQSAIPVPGVVPLFDGPAAISALEDGEVVIFVAGTGNPYFTTDTAAALRGVQIHADALLKGTKVDGVYSADPETNPDAEFYPELTYQQVLAQSLGVMDLSAAALCAAQGLEVVVYNARTPGTLGRVLDREKVGTIIHG